MCLIISAAVSASNPGVASLSASVSNLPFVSIRPLVRNPLMTVDIEPLTLHALQTHAAHQYDSAPYHRNSTRLD